MSFDHFRQMGGQDGGGFHHGVVSQLRIGALALADPERGGAGKTQGNGTSILDNILTNTLLPDMSRELLASMAEGRHLGSIRVGIGEGGSFVYS